MKGLTLSMALLAASTADSTEAAVQLAQARSQVVLQSGGTRTEDGIVPIEQEVRTFDGPFDTTRERPDIGVGRGRLGTAVPGGILSSSTAYASQVTTTVNTTQTFEFTDLGQPLQVTYAAGITASFISFFSDGQANASLDLVLLAPDGRALLRGGWSGGESGLANRSAAFDLGPVTFLAEPGLYRLELAGVTTAIAGSGGGPQRFSRASLVTFTRLETAAVPEPSQWLLLIAGFGVVGSSLRRVRRDARVLLMHNMTGGLAVLRGADTAFSTA